MPAEEVASFRGGGSVAVAEENGADAPGGEFPLEPLARGGADFAAAAGRRTPSMDDAHDANAVGARAIELRFEAAQGFRDGRQAGFDVEVAHRRAAGAAGRTGALRGLAEGADGGPGGDFFAADLAGFHGTASGSDSSRRSVRN